MDEKIAEGIVVFGPDETTVPRLKSYLFSKTEQVMRSVHFSYAQTATQEFDKIFGGVHVFDNPKHYVDIAKISEYLTDEDDLILDFFAGSCTTAHAIYSVNRQKHRNRRFICVQLQEPVNDKANSGKNAIKLGLNTISEIGKERMRRVIKIMLKEDESKLNLMTREIPEDLGFKVFKLAESNYKPWSGPENKEPDAYATQMAAFTDPFVPGWKPENVIWEVAIKEGYGLNSEIIHMNGIKENSVYRVTDPDTGQSFRICLDEELKLAALLALGLGKNDLFICRDKAMTDELIANLALQCRLKTI